MSNFLNIHTAKVGFEVLTTVSAKMAVFWVVAPCSLVEDSSPHTHIQRFSSYYYSLCG
jgi:hypothetical protein